MVLLTIKSNPKASIDDSLCAFAKVNDMENVHHMAAVLLFLAIKPHTLTYLPHYLIENLFSDICNMP